MPAAWSNMGMMWCQGPAMLRTNTDLHTTILAPSTECRFANYRFFILFVFWLWWVPRQAATRHPPTRLLAPQLVL